MRTRFVRWMILGGLFGVMLLGLAWAGLQVWQPKPAGKLLIATGGSDGAYDAYAQGLKKYLEARGLQVVLRPQLEGIDALKELFKDDTALDAAFVKGGFAATLQGRLASARAREWHDTNLPKVRSLGRMFYEPIWVFVRADYKIENLRELKGTRIWVGTKTSGTRRIALQLLKANGVEGPEKDKPAEAHHATLVEEVLPEDGGPIIRSEADAGFLILPPDSPKVQALLRNPKLKLLDFGKEADAYTTRFPSLVKLTLHQGSIEFAPTIPTNDTTLVATMPALVVKDDLHPALAAMLTDAVVHVPKSGFDKQGDPILFHDSGTFPLGSDPEYQMSEDAKKVYKTGELPYLLGKAVPVVKALQMPFGVAAFADAHGAQTILLLIPMLTILYPIFKIVPMIYTWSVRQRLLYWYRQLKGLEGELDSTDTPSEVASHLQEIDRIDHAVRRIRVPLNFTDQLYDLRGHIDLVRRRLEMMASPVRAAA